MKWIKCSDRLPKKDQEVLIYTKETWNCRDDYGKYFIYGLCTYDSEQKCFFCIEDCAYCYLENTTHWAAPEPPKEREAMKKYKIKNPYVEAVKYRKGMEDYFVCGLRWIPCFEQVNNYCDMDSTTCKYRQPLIISEITGVTAVCSTDYIVKVNGETKVMNEDDFNKQYELVEE